MRTAEDLAINGNDFSREDRANRLRPSQERLGERLRIQPGKHPPKGVMGRDPVRQLEKRPKPGQPARAKRGHAHPIVGPTQDGADGDHQNVEQLMIFRPIEAWARDLSEMGNECRTNGLRHGWLQSEDRPLSQIECPTVNLDAIALVHTLRFA
jgi:hypothetical protein